MKIMEESKFWCLAQTNEARRKKEEHEAEMTVMKSLSVPPRGWIKCNVGIAWNKNQARSGAAWVMRDDSGKVKMHSRRAFSFTESLQKAKYKGLMWALDSCHTHHLNRVIIAIDDVTLPNVILRPKAWPDFRCQYAEIMNRLKRLEWWRVAKEERATNTGAFLIAQA